MLYLWGMRTQQLRVGHYRPDGRTLVAFDIENLMGGTRFAAVDAAKTWQRVRDLCAVPPTAQVVVGASATTTVLQAHAVFGTSAAIRYRPGKDGADWELLNLLLNERVEQRFERVVIASGDGGFAITASHLLRQGVAVSVVASRSALSKSLIKRVPDIRLLETPANSGSAA